MGRGSTIRITRFHYATLALLAAIAVALVLTFVRASDDDEPAAVRTLSAAGQGAFNPRIAIDDSGRATIAWQRFGGSNSRIQSVRLDPDGTPGKVRTLSKAGNDAVNPELVVDSGGRATIVWERFDGRNVRVQSARLAAGGSPEEVRTLSEAGEDAALPQIAIDSADRATVVWHRSEGSSFLVESVRLDPDGEPEDLQSLSDVTEGAFDAQIAIDGADRATVVWRRSDGSNNRVQSVRIDAEGRPEEVQTLSSGGLNAADPQIAIDSADRATVVWQRFDGKKFRVQSVRLDADRVPDEVRTLSHAGQNADRSRVAIDASDRATVVWQRSDGSAHRVQSVRLDADADPGRVRTLSDPGEGAFTPELAIEGGASATVVWQRSDGTTQRIQSVRLAAGRTPGTVETVSDPGGAGNPQIAFGADDRGTIVWQRFDGTNTRIQSIPVGAG
jgi:hypothetical protein